MAGQKIEDYGWSNTELAESHGYLVPTILKLMNKLNAKKVLDLGCGNGALCRILSESGFNVVGCDADEEGIRLAKQADSNSSYKVISIDEDPLLLGDSSFDVVVSTEVIEHLYLPRALPNFANSVLKENGFLIISTPYHGYLKNLVLGILGKWDNHHTALWDGGHIKFWSPTTLTKLLEEEGFSVTEFHGVGRFRYLWKSMILVAQKL